ncbi:hypothetical protein [Bacillus sp. Cs-700]|uniref:hypothetical protein n=1 Tax=Bacillus sp. Cs-700 TaxID=2589818 RepID=UPI001F60D128|nr:hypothetical protein [Bacillus sp. Cs-700]
MSIFQDEVKVLSALKTSESDLLFGYYDAYYRWAGTASTVKEAFYYTWYRRFCKG